MLIDKIIKKELMSFLTSIIILALLFIGVSFAAFFSIKEGNEQVLTVGDLAITFCDDSSCESGYTNIGQVIGSSNGELKSVFPYSSDSEALSSTPYIFKVINSGTVRNYLTIKLVEDATFTPSGDYADYESVTTNYASHLKVGISECPNGEINKDDVSIKKYSSLTDNIIVNGVMMNPDVEKVYCLWTWLDSATPNEVQNTYFVANLEFAAEYRPINLEFVNYPEYSLGYYILNDNNGGFADNVNSTYVNNSSGGIDFSIVSSDTNGKGLYYTTDLTKTEDYNGDGTGERVYYYRGDVNNNNVLFAGYCWKIVRTNEDGSIKLRYSGQYDGVLKCDSSSAIGSSAYNYTYGDNAYVGYMMGIDNQCSSGNCVGTINTTSYTHAHSNVYDSTIKEYIDNWYEINILTQGTGVTDKIANTIYCNDRKIMLNQLGYGKNDTRYAIYDRLFFTYKPQYLCEQINDKFTLSVAAGGEKNYGNNVLKYPVALLTGDELSYAGNKSGVSNGNNFLNFSNWYWTMSSTNFETLYANVINLNSGYIVNGGVYSSGSVLPVISLKFDTMVSAGTGIALDPYVIETGENGLVVHINFNNKDYVMYPGINEAGNVMISLYDADGKQLTNKTVSISTDTKYINIALEYNGSAVPAVLNGVFTDNYFTPLAEQIDIELN